jgi:hypothetical protein
MHEIDKSEPPDLMLDRLVCTDGIYIGHARKSAEGICLPGYRKARAAQDQEGQLVILKGQNYVFGVTQIHPTFAGKRIP